MGKDVEGSGRQDGFRVPEGYGHEPLASCHFEVNASSKNGHSRNKCHIVRVNIAKISYYSWREPE
jgi:hypothetical protein